MDEKQLQLLWDLHAKNGGFASFGEFQQLMNNPASRKIYFEEANPALGFKDYTDFETTLRVKKKEAASQPAVPPASAPSPVLNVSGAPSAATTGASPSPLPSAESTAEPIDPPVAEDDIIGQLRRASDLSRRQKTVSSGIGAGGVPVSTSAPDDVAVAEAKQIRERLKTQYGYKDEDLDALHSEFSDFPGDAYSFFKDDQGNPKYSQEGLLQLRKANPIEYQQTLNNLKNTYALATAGGAAVANEYNHLHLPSQTLTEFEQKVKAQQQLVMQYLPEGDRERAKERIEQDARMFLNPASPSLQNDYAHSGMRDLVDVYQYAGLKQLQLFHPQQYEQYVKWLKTPVQKTYTHQMPLEVASKIQSPVAISTQYDTPDSAGGRLSQKTVDEELAMEGVKRNLANLGRQAAAQYIQREQYRVNDQYKAATSYEERNRLALEYRHLESVASDISGDAKNDDSRYPLSAQLKFDEQVKELSSQDPGMLYYGTMRFVKMVAGVPHTLENLAANSTSLQRQRLGESRSFENYLYLPENLRPDASPVVLDAPAKVREGIRKIEADTKLSEGEKYQQKVALLADNQDKIKQVTNPAFGKSKNFFTKATAYHMVGFVGDIAGLMFTSAAMPKVASVIDKTMPLFLTSQNDFFTQAVAEGRPDPNTYANLHAAIVTAAGLISDRLEYVKKVIGGNKRLSAILADVDEKTWNDVVAKNASRINRFKAAAATATVENLKQAATWGAGVPLAGELADKVVYGKDMPDDWMSSGLHGTKSMFIGQLPFYLFHIGSGYRQAPHAFKSLLWELGDNKTLMLRRIQDDLEGGKISPSQAEERSAAVSEIASLQAKVPQVNEKGKPLSDQERADYLHNLYVKTKANAAKADVPETQKEKLEEVKTAADAGNMEILKGKAKQEPVPQEEAVTKDVPFYENKDNLPALVQKIVKGEELTADEQQLRKNFAADVEVSLQQEAAAPKENADHVTVGDMLDKAGSYNGERGVFYLEGQAVVFKVEGGKREYELGNINEVKDHPLSDYGIEREQSVVETTENGGLKVRGQEYFNRERDPLKAVNYDKEGNLASVTLETDKGERRTFRGQVAEDLAYQIHLQEITKDNASTERFEQFLQTDEETQKEIDRAGVQETPHENANGDPQTLQPQAAGAAGADGAAGGTAGRTASPVRETIMRQTNANVRYADDKALSDEYNRAQAVLAKKRAPKAERDAAAATVQRIEKHYADSFKAEVGAKLDKIGIPYQIEQTAGYWKGKGETSFAIHLDTSDPVKHQQALHALADHGMETAQDAIVEQQPLSKEEKDRLVNQNINIFEHETEDGASIIPQVTYSFGRDLSAAEWAKLSRYLVQKGIKDITGTKDGVIVLKFGLKNQKELDAFTKELHNIVNDFANEHIRSGSTYRQEFVKGWYHEADNLDGRSRTYNNVHDSIEKRFSQGRGSEDTGGSVAGDHAEPWGNEGAGGSHTEPTPVNNSLTTQQFFSDTVNGKNQPKRPWKPILALNNVARRVLRNWERFRGAFDAHIETNIPAFRDIQIRKIGAIVTELKNGGLVIDLGGSEGGFVKTITSENPKIKTINLDMNPDMQAAHNRKPVAGSTFVLGAFGADVTDDKTGVTTKRYDPPQKADVVHETMLFQFITPERQDFVNEVADHYVKPDGVFIVEEKVIGKGWDANEVKKDKDFKSQYYDNEAIKVKQEQVVAGMKGNQATELHLLDALSKRFKYVLQYWDSGNFKGYIATNNKERAERMIQTMGDVRTEFTSRKDLIRLENENANVSQAIESANRSGKTNVEGQAAPATASAPAEGKPAAADQKAVAKEQVSALAQAVAEKGAQAALAEFLRSKKLDTSNTALKSSVVPTFGLPEKIANAAIEMIARHVEAGTKLGNAVAKVMKWVDEQMSGQKWDKGAFGKHMTQTFVMKVGGEDRVVQRDDSAETAKVVDGFYSPLEQRILDVKSSSGTAKQWLQHLNTEEAKWTGVKEFLEGKKGDEKVTKQELQEFLQNNRVQIVEVVKGNSDYRKKYDEAEQKAQELEREANIIEMVKLPEAKTNAEYEALQRELAQTQARVRQWRAEQGRLQEHMGGGGGAKYENWQIPGEKTDYKEVLLTLPRKETGKGSVYLKQKTPVGDRWVVYDADGNEISREYHESAAKDKVLEQTKFQSSHFDEPNIVAHIRLSTRKDSEGRTVQFVQEVQSDWGQKGKREGFKVTPEERKTIEAKKEKIAAQLHRDFGITTVGGAADHYHFERLKDGWWETVDRETEGLPKGAYELMRDYAEQVQQHDGRFGGKVNPAPFVTDTNQWAKLGLKYALKHAVESGAERLVWSTGEQQNQLFDLAKQVDELVYTKAADGTYVLEGFKDDRSVFHQSKIAEKDLEGLVGKEVAKKIVDDAGKAPRKMADIEKEQEALDKELEAKYGITIEDGAIGVLEEKGVKEGDKQAAEYLKRVSDLNTEWMNAYENENKPNDGIRQGKLTGSELSVGGKGMKGFYGDPKEGKEGIIGGLAKSLVRDLTGKDGVIEEIKLPISADKGLTDDEIRERAKPVKADEAREYLRTYQSGDSKWLYTIEHGRPFRIRTMGDFNEASPSRLYMVDMSKDAIQHAIAITPELKASVKQGMPLFGEAKAKAFADKLRGMAEKIEKEGVFPSWLRVDDPTIQKQGADFDKIVATALKLVADAVEKGADLAKSIEQGLATMRKAFKGSEKEWNEFSGQFTEAMHLAHGKPLDETTKIANAVNDAFIEGKFGAGTVDHILSLLQDTDTTKLYNHIKQKIDAGVIDLKAVRDRVLTTKTGSEADQAVLLYEMADLKGKERQLISEIINEKDEATQNALQRQLVDVQNTMLDNALANRTIGRSASTVFRIRQLIVNRELSLLDMEQQYLSAKKLKELTPEQRREVKAAYTKIRELQAKMEKTRADYETARKKNDLLLAQNRKMKELALTVKSASKEKRTAKTNEQIKKSNERIQQALDELRRMRGDFNDVTRVSVKTAAVIGKIAAEKVYQGTLKFSDMVAEILDDVKGVFPDWTEKDVVDHLLPEFKEAGLIYDGKASEKLSQAELRAKEQAMNKAEKAFALRRFEWDRERRNDLVQSRPFSEKVLDSILRWQRFAVLSYPSTMVKLAAVVGHQVLVKPLKFATQKAIYTAFSLPKLWGGNNPLQKAAVWGDPKLHSLAAYYGALIRNFSLANLKEQFAGIDTKEVLYGRGMMYEEWAAAKGLLELPGRSHGWVKSFIKNPEFQFAHEQLLANALHKMQELQKALGDKGLSAEKRAKLQKAYNEVDVTNFDNLEALNRLALEHGKWSIMMNDNAIVQSFSRGMNRMLGHENKGVKVLGALAKSEVPIVKIPMNFVARSFAYQWGLAKALTGSKWMGGDTPSVLKVIYRGSEKLTPQQSELLARTLSVGSVGVSFFVLGYLNRGNVQKNDDGSYEIFDVHVAKNLVHSPEFESFFTGSEVGHAHDDDESMVEAMVNAQQELFMKNPYSSMFTYGFVASAMDAGKSKDEEKGRTKLLDAANKRVTDMFIPGFVKQSAGWMDNETGGFSMTAEPVKRKVDGETYWQRLMQQVELNTPGLRDEVPEGGAKSGGRGGVRF